MNVIELKNKLDNLIDEGCENYNVVVDPVDPGHFNVTHLHVNYRDEFVEII